MKKVKTSLEQLSKDSLIENLMLDSIKGGCCKPNGTVKGTKVEASRGIIEDVELD